jgi:phospholipase/carboxylesterase
MSRGLVESFAHRWIEGDSTAGGRRTLLLLHGTGGDEHDLLELGRTLDPGASLLSPRGKILESGAPRFFRRLAEGVFDQEDLRFRTAELSAWIRAAIEEYEIDPAGLTAVGYSNGANIAASLLLSGSAPFRQAILLRAMVPFEPQTPPDLHGNQVLMLSGTRDPIIPPTSSQKLATLLEQSGANVTLRWSETGHGLERRELAVAREWLTGLPAAAAAGVPAPQAL